MDPIKISLNTLALSTAAVICLEILKDAIVSSGIIHPLTGLGLARLSQILLLIFIVRFDEKKLKSIGLERFNITSGFKKGLVWSAGFGVAAGIAFCILYMIGLNPLKLVQTRLPAGRIDIILFACIGAILAPVAEEIFFRGILYGYLRRWGFLTALLLSTVLFVLPHSVQDALPLTQIVGGVVFATAYEFEKNLIVPIVIHCLGNLAIFSLTILVA